MKPWFAQSTTTQPRQNSPYTLTQVSLPESANACKNSRENRAASSSSLHPPSGRCGASNFFPDLLKTSSRPYFFYPPESSTSGSPESNDSPPSFPPPVPTAHPCSSHSEAALSETRAASSPPFTCEESHTSRSLQRCLLRST